MLVLIYSLDKSLCLLNESARMTEKGSHTLTVSCAKFGFLASGYFFLVFKALASPLYLPTHPGSLKPLRQLLPLGLHPVGELNELLAALCRGSSLDSAAVFVGMLSTSLTIGPAQSQK